MLTMSASAFDGDSLAGTSWEPYLGRYEMVPQTDDPYEIMIDTVTWDNGKPNRQWHYEIFEYGEIDISLNSVIVTIVTDQETYIRDLHLKDNESEPVLSFDKSIEPGDPTYWVLDGPYLYHTEEEELGVKLIGITSLSKDKTVETAIELIFVPYSFGTECILKPISLEPKEYETALTGTAVSNRGDYDLAVSGFLKAELKEGENELTLADIRQQTIAIVARNNANDVRRVMREQTIETMTVTVQRGEIKKISFVGRVQTDGGTLDRYTAVINF